MKLKKLLFIIALSCFAVFFAVGCKQENQIKSIAIKEYSQEAPIEILIGEFNYANYTVVVIDSKGVKQEMTLTEDMISEVDKIKFFQEGNQTITVRYRDVSCQITVSVKRKEFSSNVTLNSFTTVYTGETFTVEVEGDLPGGAKVFYPQGNTFKNVGGYDITAILQCDGYVTKTLSATIVVEKATYDMTNAKLYDQTFVYDREPHTISLKGQESVVEGEKVYADMQVPQGVHVTYTITKVKEGDGSQIPAESQQTREGKQATDAGTYLVCAKFKGDEANYNEIPNSTAYIVIERAKYKSAEIIFEDKTVVYDGNEKTLALSETSKLGHDVFVSYQIKKLKNGLGEEVEDEFKTGNKATNAGEYIVNVVLSLTGKSAFNYYIEESEKSAYLVIERADYSHSVSNLYLDSKSFTFDDYESYYVDIVGELPKDVNVWYKITDKEGNIIAESTDWGKIRHFTFYVITEGEYKARVSFSHGNENYLPIDDMFADVVIDSPVVKVTAEFEGGGIEKVKINNEMSYEKYSVFVTIENDIFGQISGTNTITEQVELLDYYFLSEEERGKFSSVGIKTIYFVYEGYVFGIEIEVVE